MTLLELVRAGHSKSVASQFRGGDVIASLNDPTRWWRIEEIFTLGQLAECSRGKARASFDLGKLEASLRDGRLELKADGPEGDPRW